MINKRSIAIARVILVLLMANWLFGSEAQAQTSAITVTGRVYDTADNSPVRQSAIMVTGSGFSGSAWSDDNGMYSVGSCHTGEDLTISCMRAGYRHYSTVIPAISPSTSAASYSHDIPLTTIIPSGTVGYGAGQTEIIYMVGEEDGIEREYTPGVDPDELEERKSKSSEDETVEEDIDAGNTNE